MTHKDNTKYVVELPAELAGFLLPFIEDKMDEANTALGEHPHPNGVECDMLRYGKERLEMLKFEITKQLPHKPNNKKTKRK